MTPVLIISKKRHRDASGDGSRSPSQSKRARFSDSSGFQPLSVEALAALRASTRDRLPLSNCPNCGHHLQKFYVNRATCLFMCGNPSSKGQPVCVRPGILSFGCMFPLDSSLHDYLRPVDFPEIPTAASSPGKPNRRRHALESSACSEVVANRNRESPRSCGDKTASTSSADTTLVIPRHPRELERQRRSRPSHVHPTSTETAHGVSNPRSEKRGISGTSTASGAAMSPSVENLFAPTASSHAFSSPPMAARGPSTTDGGSLGSAAAVNLSSVRATSTAQTPCTAASSPTSTNCPASGSNAAARSSGGADTSETRSRSSRDISNGGVGGLPSSGVSRDRVPAGDLVPTTSAAATTGSAVSSAIVARATELPELSSSDDEDDHLFAADGFRPVPTVHFAPLGSVVGQQHEPSLPPLPTPPTSASSTSSFEDDYMSDAVAPFNGVGGGLRFGHGAATNFAAHSPSQRPQRPRARVAKSAVVPHAASPASSTDFAGGVSLDKRGLVELPSSIPSSADSHPASRKDNAKETFGKQGQKEALQHGKTSGEAVISAPAHVPVPPRPTSLSSLSSALLPTLPGFGANAQRPSRLVPVAATKKGAAPSPRSLESAALAALLGNKARPANMRKLNPVPTRATYTAAVRAKREAEAAVRADAAAKKQVASKNGSNNAPARTRKNRKTTAVIAPAARTRKKRRKDAKRCDVGNEVVAADLVDLADFPVRTVDANASNPDDAVAVTGTGESCGGDVEHSSSVLEFARMLEVGLQGAGLEANVDNPDDFEM